MTPFSGVTAMALSGTMTTVLAAVAIGTILGKLVWRYYIYVPAPGLRRNDEDGVHWLPETILHVSKVTDDQVAGKISNQQHNYILILSSELLFDYIGEPCEQLQIL